MPMPRGTLALLLSSVVALSPTVAAQGTSERHPDLSGRWTVEGPAKDLPVFCGAACEIVQDGDRLSVRASGETHVIQIGGTNDEKLPLGFTLSTSAAWAGNLLTITSTVRASDGALYGLPTSTVLSLRKGQLLVYNTSAVFDLVVQTHASYSITK